MGIKIYGIGVSPYVRKVRMALAARGLEYENIPVIPGGEGQPKEFLENSPLGKIPLAQIDGEWIPDSSLILWYLENTRDQNKLLSDDPKVAARQLWFEEYADSHMVSVISGHLFAELILAPLFFNRESNHEEIELARTVEIPAIFDYIESQLQGDYLVGNAMSIADIAVGSSFVTMQHCNFACDASRWPRTAAYIGRITSNPAFTAIIEEEKALLGGA